MYYKVYVDDGSYCRISARSRYQARDTFREKFKNDGLWISEYTESAKINLVAVFYPRLDRWVNTRAAPGEPNK